MQSGLPLDDAKAVPSIGAGVVKLRIWNEAGTFRVMYAELTRKRLKEPMKELAQKKRFASVWDAIEDTPQEAASMRTRADLMMSLAKVIRQQGMTQAQAAELFGVTQPRFFDLVRGKINRFSLDTLMDMAAPAGMAPVVKLSKPKVHVRRSRRAAAIA